MTVAAGGILALDLSSITGWAVGGVADVAPAFGCWHLPLTGGEGARYAAFENSLAAAMDEYAPARVILEAPLSFQALLGVSTMRVMCQQLTLRGIAYAEAWRASVPIQEVSSDIVRLALLGQSRFSKGTVKRVVLGYCKSQGWNCPDDNAADACMIWLWLVGQMRGAPRIAGPLFAAGRVIQ